jgi:hypothetical protein
MNQNRKDQDVPNRQSNMEQAEGSRDDESRGTERNRSSESTSHSRSVMDDQETFEHGSGTSSVAKGMGSSSERGMESGRSGTKGSDRQSGDLQSGDRQSGGISNRSLDEEREEQSRLPERGRSQSEE